MLAELLRELITLSTDKSRVRHYTHEDAPGVLWVKDGESDAQTVHVEPYELPQFEEVASLAAWAKDRNATAIYVSACGVEVFTTSVRRRGSMPIATSESWTALQGMKPMTPPDAVRFLTYEVKGVPQEVIGALRRIDFKRSDNASYQANRGDEGFGRQVDAKAQGLEKIPEVFAVPIAPFDGIELRSIVESIYIGIDLLPSSGQVCFRVMPDEFSRVMEVAVQQLAGLISKYVEESIPIYIGSTLNPGDGQG